MEMTISPGSIQQVDILSVEPLRNESSTDTRCALIRPAGSGSRPIRVVLEPISRPGPVLSRASGTAPAAGAAANDANTDASCAPWCAPVAASYASGPSTASFAAPAYAATPYASADVCTGAWPPGAPGHQVNSQAPTAPITGYTSGNAVYGAPHRPALAAGQAFYPDAPHRPALAAGQAFFPDAPHRPALAAGQAFYPDAATPLAPGGHHHPPLASLAQPAPRHVGHRATTSVPQYRPQPRSHHPLTCAQRYQPYPIISGMPAPGAAESAPIWMPASPPTWDGHGGQRAGPLPTISNATGPVYAFLEAPTAASPGTPASSNSAAAHLIAPVGAPRVADPAPAPTHRYTPPGGHPYNPMMALPILLPPPPPSPLQQHPTSASTSSSGLLARQPSLRRPEPLVVPDFFSVRESSEALPGAAAKEVYDMWKDGLELSLEPRDSVSSSAGHVPEACRKALLLTSDRSNTQPEYVPAGYYAVAPRMHTQPTGAAPPLMADASGDERQSPALTATQGATSAGPTFAAGTPPPQQWRDFPASAALPPAPLAQHSVTSDSDELGSRPSRGAMGVLDQGEEPSYRSLPPPHGSEQSTA